MNLAAVIPCGGRSERMRDALNGVPSKLLLQLDSGLPIICRSVEAILNVVGGGIVVIVVPEGLELQFKNTLSERFTALQMEQIRFVAGGATRQISVCNGLELLATGDVVPELVLIHDGARPFVEYDDIVKLLDEAAGVESGKMAVTLATPVTNTVKRAQTGGDGKVVVIDTPPRSELWEIQTPQLFSFGLILKAHRRFAGADTEFTDDCQLIEAIGGEVRLVEGSRGNIKVTTPSDV